MTDIEERIREREARREARELIHRAKGREQYLADLDALEEVEAKYAVGEVVRLRVDGADGLGYVEGYPVVLAFRRPTAIEIKRFRARLKPKHERDKPDAVEATEELASACLIYPSRDLFDALVEIKPGIKTQAGVLAGKLAQAAEEADVKS